MADLLQSLHDTLADDPTPLEIIALDDGSTDDSLDTLRAWSKRTWRRGQQFVKLIEAEHCGILSITANRLVREAAGSILVRLDGDITVQTPNWAQRLVRVFDAGPSQLGVVGPKQLKPSGVIHAFGDFLIHPKGYHHVAEHLPADAVDSPLEVDHVMGCFYCFKREVWEQLGGFDQQMLRGQTVDFGLRARLAGYRCFAIPQIVFVHRHGLRRPWRDTRADTPEGLTRSFNYFREKWGFDRIAPDLDVVRRRYGHTPLLWNPVVCARCTDSRKTGDVDLESSEWGQFGRDSTLQHRLQFQVAVTCDVVQQLGLQRQVTVLGCGSGLLMHLLALQGFSCQGTSGDPKQAQFARSMMSRQKYPAASMPRIIAADAARPLPIVDGGAATVLIYHMLETHPNPSGLLAEAARVAGAGGHLIVISQRQEWAAAASGTQVYRYRYAQLMRQIQAAAPWTILTDPKNDKLSQPIVIAARIDPNRKMPSTSRSVVEKPVETALATK